jgi:hypothetical protein
MIKYKLTRKNDTTYNNTLWGPGITHETDGSGKLCSKGWIHYYDSPELAVLLNIIHAGFHSPKLWECEAEGQHLTDKGLKGGCTKLTTVREIPIPKITSIQKIAFAILCSLETINNNEYYTDIQLTDIQLKLVSWARGWLDGSDRSSLSASRICSRILKNNYDTITSMYQQFAHAAWATDDLLNDFHVSNNTAMSLIYAAKVKTIDFDSCIKKALTY